MYRPEEVAQIVRAHTTYVDGLRTSIASFPTEVWMSEERYRFLQSDEYKKLTQNYEIQVPEDVRNDLERDVNFFLRRVLNPRDENDSRLPTYYRSARDVIEGRKLPETKKGRDDGND